MSVSDENRQCLVCEQIVPSGMLEVVTVKMRPENRIVHVTCAKKIEKALQEWRMLNGESA